GRPAAQRPHRGDRRRGAADRPRGPPDGGGVMEFKRAALQEVDPKPAGSGPPKLVKGSKIEVQINPASLRLQMANSVDSGKGYGRPSTQYQGTASSTLSFDLVFDT